MKVWYLVIVLVTAGMPDMEQHVAIEMPDEATCETVRENFVYATQILIHTGDDKRIPLKIDEKTCVEADDNE